MDIPNLSPEGAQIGPLPVLSGYRTAEELRLRLEFDYLALYENPTVDRNDFKLVVPVSRLISLQFFGLTHPR